MGIDLGSVAFSRWIERFEPSNLYITVLKHRKYNAAFYLILMLLYQNLHKNEEELKAVALLQYLSIWRENNLSN